jgi:hypothetical protein
MSFRQAQTISLWLSCILLLACGPNTGDQTTDSGATIDGTTDPTGGHECLVPENADVANASDELACVMGEALDGYLELDVTEWPELSPESDCPFLLKAAEVDVAVPCTVTSITSDATAAAVGLECTDDDQIIHSLTLKIGSPALCFAVCESAVLKLNYRQHVFSCFYDVSTAFALRDEDGLIVAASFSGSPPPWLAPLEFSTLSDAGCLTESDLCSSNKRTAIRISDEALDGDLVYDNTRRIVQLSNRFVVQARATFVEVWDGCEDFSVNSVDLVLADM